MWIVLLFFPVEGTGSNPEWGDYSDVVCCWVCMHLAFFYGTFGEVTFRPQPHNKQYWPIAQRLGAQPVGPCGASHFPTSGGKSPIRARSAPPATCRSELGSMRYRVQLPCSVGVVYYGHLHAAPRSPRARHSNGPCGRKYLGVAQKQKQNQAGQIGMKTGKFPP